jgi:hypothetical protein
MHKQEKSEIPPENKKEDEYGAVRTEFFSINASTSISFARGEISALNDEARENTMANAILKRIVRSFFSCRQSAKVFSSLWYQIGIEL